MLSIDYDRTSNIFVDVNVDPKNHNFNVPLILYKYNIMLVMQRNLIHAGIYLLLQSMYSVYIAVCKQNY